MTFDSVTLKPSLTPLERSKNQAESDADNPEVQSIFRDVQEIIFQQIANVSLVKKENIEFVSELTADLGLSQEQIASIGATINRKFGGHIANSSIHTVNDWVQWIYINTIICDEGSYGAFERKEQVRPEYQDAFNLVKEVLASDDSEIKVDTLEFGTSLTDLFPDSYERDLFFTLLQQECWGIGRYKKNELTVGSVVRMVYHVMASAATPAKTLPVHIHSCVSALLAEPVDAEDLRAMSKNILGIFQKVLSNDGNNFMVTDTGEQRRIAEVVEKEFGITPTSSQVWDLHTPLQWAKFVLLLQRLGTGKTTDSNPANQMATERIDPSLFARVKTVLLKELGTKEEDIQPQARLIEDLGADSLDVPGLMSALEAEFGITIEGYNTSDECRYSPLSVGELAGLVGALVKARGSA